MKIGLQTVFYLYFGASGVLAAAQITQSAEITGTITDFQNHPIAGAEVDVRDAHFQDAATSSTDVHGMFRLTVKKGRYMALFACKDYKVKHLEFWAWNLMVDDNMIINARIDDLEVYAINAFLIQREPPSMQIYFRPMSLERFKKAGGKAILDASPFIDIAPKLSTNDVNVTINGEPVKILELNRVPERDIARPDTQEIWAYLMQTTLPKHQDDKIWKIRIALRDTETKEQGEGCLFWEKPVFDNTRGN